MRLFFNESIKRGLVQLVRRQLYWLVMMVVPIACAIFLLELMKPGGIQRVPVGIVDLDNSMVSRRIERNLRGMQQVDIVNHYTNYRAAIDAVQRGDIYGFI
ncbi:MAG: ABC transporter permease, partial [Muribaculaceae bacterium]|nr:ABC transporter permease [Muribaculaceae bacterium]